jgi:hypothetical protein
MATNLYGEPIDLEVCPEPDGNELVDDVEVITAHEVMVREGGQCPWCGAIV